MTSPSLRSLWPFGYYTAQSAVVIGALLLVATTSADVDLWGHLRFGLDILDEAQIPSEDPYSFTSDRAWINHEWLSELLFAVAWRMAGAPGLIALKVAVVGTAIAFVWRTLRARAVAGHARALLCGLAFVGIYPRVVHVRPQLFSVLLFAVLLWVIAEAESGRRRKLALAVPILLLWANLHGGWITGLATLGLWTAGDFWLRRASGFRASDGVGWTLAAAAATCVNPYGIGLWGFLAETVRPGRARIGEWDVVWQEPAVFVVWILLAGLTLVAFTQRRRVRPISLFITGLWGAASLKVVRLDAFFALSVAGLLGPAIEAVLGRDKQRVTPMLGVATKGAILTAVALLALSLPVARSALTCIRINPAGWPEPAAVEFIHRQAAQGRMITHFTWGEFAIWHVPRSLKISLDGRRETVYSDAILSGHFALYDGRPEARSFVDSLNADYAWLPRRSAAVGLLEQWGWSKIFGGDVSIILAAPMRAGTNGGAGFAPPLTTAAPRCFPGS